jgi:hypothetical protein
MVSFLTINVANKVEETNVVDTGLATPMPTSVLSGKKRNHQNTLDNFFQRGNKEINTSPRRKSRVIEDSDSDLPEPLKLFEKFKSVDAGVQVPDDDDLPTSPRRSAKRRCVVVSDSDSDVMDVTPTKANLSMLYDDYPTVPPNADFDDHESVYSQDSSESSESISQDMGRIQFEPRQDVEPEEADEEDEQLEEDDEQSKDEDAQSEEDSAEESDGLISPRTRRRRHLASSPPPEAEPQTPVQNTNDELEEEVRDLTSSARKSQVTRKMRDSETRNRKKSEFQKNLENLRRRKSGAGIESENENENDEEADVELCLYDSSDVGSVASDDFVVEDEEELTLEQRSEIPPEFTSAAYQGPQANFKVVIQAEVYALLHPKYRDLDYTGIRCLDEGLT